METGKRDQLITLQSLTETNVNGELTPQYADDSPPDQEWAYILTEHGSEAFQAARLDASRLIRVNIPYRADVKTDWRIIWDDVAYMIKSIDPSKKRKGELWFTAEATGKL